MHTDFVTVQVVAQLINSKTKVNHVVFEEKIPQHDAGHLHKLNILAPL